MKPTKEQVKAYKSMAKQSPQTMEGIIKSHLEQNCQKYVGNEDKFDRCISHLSDTVLEILGGRNAAKNNRLAGQVPAETCFRICMDYFNDEIWKAEDEEEAKKKAAKTSAKKQNSVDAKCSVDDVTDEDDDNDDTVCETPAVQPKKKEADQLDRKWHQRWLAIAETFKENVK